MIQTLLQYPITARAIKTLIEWIDFIWMGYTAKYSGDTVSPVWYTNSFYYAPNPYGPPEYHPISLKYLWIIIQYVLNLVFHTQIMTKKDYYQFNHWTPFLPKIFDDALITYYTRGSQWMALANSETEWREIVDDLTDWNEEHRGKEVDDATFNVITIYLKNKDETNDTLDDVTSEYFPFMSPMGNFINRSHQNRVLAKYDKHMIDAVLVTEDMEGTRVEI